MADDGWCIKQLPQPLAQGNLKEEILFQDTNTAKYMIQ